MSGLCQRFLRAGISRLSRSTFAVPLFRSAAGRVAGASKRNRAVQISRGYTSSKEATGRIDVDDLMEKLQLILRCESMKRVGGLFHVTLFDRKNKVVKIVRENPGEKIKVTFRMQHFNDCNNCNDEDWSTNEFIRKFFQPNLGAPLDFSDIFKDQMKAEYVLESRTSGFVVEIDRGGSDFLLVKCGLMSPEEAIRTGRKFRVNSFGYGLKVKVDLSAEATSMSGVNPSAGFEELLKLLSEKGVDDHFIGQVREWCRSFDPSKLEEAYTRGYLMEDVTEKS